MTGTVLSDEADALYRPLAGLDAWAAVAVDEDGWQRAGDRVATIRSRAPAWAAMVERGCRLAAAYSAGAADGLFALDEAVVLGLVGGTMTPADLGPGGQPHVVAVARAIDGATAAGPGPITEEAIRTAHATACGPQATSPVHTAAGHQDHVLAHGDYKHHPNHVRLGDGSWLAHVPVDRLGAEMGRLTGLLAGGAFAALHPASRAGFVLHALAHIGPFADGNRRVGWVLASAVSTAAGGLPLVGADVVAGGREPEPAAVVAGVQRRATALADAVERLSTTAGASTAQAAALARWEHRAATGAALADRLPAALADALGRYRRRPAVAWQSDLSTAVVDGPAVRVPLGDGRVVAERLALDAHPLDADPTVVALRAEHTGLAFAVDAGAPGTEPAGLDAWLDRVLLALAIAVAAELE